MREYIDNDGSPADAMSYSYAQMVEDKRNTEEKYFKSQGVPANNALEEHDLVNETEEVSNLDYGEKVSDPIVQSVIDKFRTRHLEGMKTYGMTMADNPAKTLEWINHVQEELMDSILYLERLKWEYKVP